MHRHEVKAHVSLAFSHSAKVKAVLVFHDVRGIKGKVVISVGDDNQLWDVRFKDLFELQKGDVEISILRHACSLCCFRGGLSEPAHIGRRTYDSITKCSLSGK